jgi:hypothetical protein
VQVSHTNGSKFFCRLLAVFAFNDANNLAHQLAFVQHSKIVLDCCPIYNKPILELKDSFNLIHVNAVDQMVEFKARKGTKDQFYLCTTVESY